MVGDNAVIALITKENPSETTVEGNVEKVGCENVSCNTSFLPLSFLCRGHDCRIYSVDSRVPRIRVRGNAKTFGNSVQRLRVKWPEFEARKTKIEIKYRRNKGTFVLSSSGKLFERGAIAI